MIRIRLLVMWPNFLTHSKSNYKFRFFGLWKQRIYFFLFLSCAKIVRNCSVGCWSTVDSGVSGGRRDRSCFLERVSRSSSRFLLLEKTAKTGPIQRAATLPNWGPPLGRKHHEHRHGHTSCISVYDVLLWLNYNFSEKIDLKSFKALISDSLSNEVKYCWHFFRNFFTS